MKITASVDLLEGEYAMLICQGEKISLPRVFLPSGVKAGSWVDIEILENCQKEVEVRENVQNLLNELKQGEHLK